jgi:putative transcriptional regulator
MIFSWALMTWGETESLRATETMLKEAGFAVSQRCRSRPSCFDFAARKNENVILIKIESDVDAFSSRDSFELKAISRNISVASILIAEKTREKPLEDDTVYSRYNVLAITPKTFENIVIQKINPLIQAGPGGYYVEIDCEAIKHRRQAIGLSVGKMAEMVGISRRTLYGYERGMAKASVVAAYNLIWTLGSPIARPVNVFEKSKSERKCILSRAKHVIERHRFLHKILGRLSRCHIATVKRAPFDFVIDVPEEKMRIIGALADDKEKELDRRVDEILSVSKIVKAYPILVTGTQEQPNIDIPCISSERFSKIKDPEDLVSSV